jgi:hypothetical protein
MTVLALLGAKALYLLFIWLASAIAGQWLSQRKGYGERLGLASGLLLSVLGVIVMLALPPKAGSTWRAEGPLPRRRRHSA